MVDMKMKQFGAHSGVIVQGTKSALEWEGFDRYAHIDRALLLTLAVEGPKWGTVQTYDGAGISAGLLHHIAAFPANKTLGSFWPLYFQCIEVAPEFALADVKRNARGQVLNAHGDALNGDMVRMLFTGSERGYTRQLTPEISARIESIHRLFADPRTYAIQAEAARDWLWKTTGKYPVGIFLPVGNIPLRTSQVLRSSDFPSPEHELAFCVVRACAVNNPRDAKEALDDALKGDVDDFPRRLYKELREERKNWVNRISRIATAAGRLGLWPKRALEQLAPQL